jgi:hypothetical protein
MVLFQGNEVMKINVPAIQSPQANGGMEFETGQTSYFPLFNTMLYSPIY